MQCMIESRGLSMVIKEESGLKFGFPDGDSVVKFDDTKFYRNSFNALPESKGVDFISTGQDAISFIEVKNCLGDEGNNRWRIAPDNQKHDTTATNNDVTGRDSFDIEVSQKVAMTLAALSGARSFGDRKDSFEELQNSVTAVFSEKQSGGESAICTIKHFVAVYIPMTEKALHAIFRFRHGFLRETWYFI